MSSAIISPAHPEQILKGLGKLWTSLGEEEKQHGKPTVLRACAMTLVVATDEPDVGFLASQTISELMHEHPARGIVLAISDTAESDLQARVLAQCWKPFGKAQQICCEQIEITARPSSWPNVGPTLAGLTAADLPVIFWCRHKGALAKDATAEQHAGLVALMSLASKMIIDTAGMDAAEAVDLLTRWQSKGKLVADLEWTRLTPWREPLAHLFEDPARANHFSNFQTLEIEHTEPKRPISALYMAAWLAQSGARVSFRQAPGFAPGVHGVCLRSATESIELKRTSADCVTLFSTNNRERRYTFGQPNLTAVMTEELSVTGFDPAFHAVLARVRELNA